MERRWRDDGEMMERRWRDDVTQSLCSCDLGSKLRPHISPSNHEQSSAVNHSVSPPFYIVYMMINHQN